MYLYELVNWLTTVVDSLVIKEAYKDEAYKGALEYIAECLMVMCSQSQLKNSSK
jgi:exocyst complex component 6